MTLDLNDLKAAIISILVFFICIGIQRYWSNRTIKSLNRRIQETEAHKLLLGNLARSERALLLFGLQTVFLILGIMGIVLCGHLLYLLEQVVGRGGLDLFAVAFLVVLWALPTFVSIYAAYMIKQVHDHPASVEAIEKKISKLKNKLLGRR